MREQVQFYQVLTSTAGVSVKPPIWKMYKIKLVKTELFVWVCQDCVSVLMFFIGLTSIYSVQTDKNVAFLSAELEPAQIITSTSTLAGQNICRKQKGI